MPAGVYPFTKNHRRGERLPRSPACTSSPSSLAAALPVERRVPDFDCVAIGGRAGETSPPGVGQVRRAAFVTACGLVPADQCAVLLSHSVNAAPVRAGADQAVGTTITSKKMTSKP